MQLELFRLPPISHSPARQQKIVLASRLIPYDLRRDRRRLTMRIDESGLHVGAPRMLGVAEIESFIQAHAAWVLEKLDALASGSVRRHLTVHDEACIPVLGKEVRIRIATGNNRGFWEDQTLWLAARPGADLAALARRALQRRALDYFRPRLAATTSQLGCPLPPLALSSARARWGSCSARSGIRLNWRLIHLPPPPVDYVIAHEVAHLVEMNHSARFWAVVERLCPDWRNARDALKRAGAELPIL